jgi:hypothetical protein
LWLKITKILEQEEQKYGKKIQKFRNKSYKNLGIKISKIREQKFQKSRNRS